MTAIDIHKVRRESLRWYLLLALNNARPESLAEEIIQSTMRSIYPDTTAVEVRRELDYLDGRKLVELRKEPSGRWWTVHQGTMGFFVNVDALEGKPVPKCWADLKKPDYRGLVGYLDPTSAAVGYVASVAINQAFGGSFDNFTPAIDYFKALAKNDAIATKQTSYARVVSGEIPVLLDYDFNAYRAKYSESGKFEFVIWCP